jgi:O-antigen/teichoic acid export membrane protein
MFLPKKTSPWSLAWSLLDRLRSDSLLRNSIFIMSSTVVTSAIGYLYWVLAARIYSTYDVGFASVSLSIMTLTSIFANVGIGSALVQLLPQRKTGYEWSLTLNVCLAMGILVSLLGGTIVALTHPVLAVQFALTRFHLYYVLLFIAGVILSTVATLVDQTFVAERVSSQMALRNAIFALLKLLLLALLVQLGAFGIFSSWVMGLALTIIFAMWVLFPRLKREYRPVTRGILKQVKSLLSSFAGQHFINIGGLLPMYLLPTFVAVQLSVTENAYFYTTWMVGSLFFMVSASVAMALFSEGSHVVSDARRQARTSILIICILLIPILLMFLFGGGPILSLFGPKYAQHGVSLLLVLMLSSVPDAITNIYVSLLRVQGRLHSAALLNLSMATITLALAWMLLPKLGIVGAGWAWLIAQSCGTLVVGGDMLFSRKQTPQPQQDSNSEEQSLGGSQSESASEDDTLKIPKISFKR